jgi:acetyl-CoA carboxylase biotin carboxyl carrier protein
VDLKQIKELMAAMGRTGTKKLCVKQEGFELTLEREGNELWRPPLIESSSALSEDYLRQGRGDAAEQALSHGGEMPSRVESPKKEDIASVYITSPMVGTYYLTPSPEDPPFAKVGDKVDKNQVVCIIEAMKVMNEIKAGLEGTIAEILVESGQPVEFGTKLFRII